MPPDTFTPRELDVMSILWDLGSATVAEVQPRLSDPLAYTTVLSVLRTLQEKGYVRHEPEGRAYRYYALVDWRAAGRRELRRLVKKIFKGSPELLLVQLVSDRGMDERELRRLRKLVDERLGDAPMGETPAGETPAGEAPAGEAPVGEASEGEEA